MKQKLLLITFDIYRPDYPTINYSIASLMATLKEYGISYSHYSINVQQYLGICNSEESDLKENSINTVIKNAIPYFKKFDFITIGVTRWSIDYTNSIIDLLGDYNGKIILGGYEITAISEFDLQKEFPRVDYFIKRYAEKPLVKLLNKEYENSQKVIIEPLDEDYLFSPYSSGILNTTTRKIYWETKRGCSFRCGFCEWGNAQIGIIKLNQERVNKDIEFFANSNIDEINILDGTFNIDQYNYQEILQQLIEYTEATITFQARFETLNDDFLAFCAQHKDRLHLEFGLQTIHENEMKIIGRKNNMNVVEKQLEKLNQDGINYEVSIIYAIPEQTVESFIDTIEFLRINKCRKIMAFPLQVPRNSELEREKDKYHITFIKDQYNVQTVASSISFSKKNRADMDRIASTLNKENQLWLINNNDKLKIESTKYQYKMSDNYIKDNIKSLKELIHHDFVSPTGLDIHQYSGIAYAKFLGSLLQVTDTDYINYALGQQSIDYKDPYNGNKPLPMEINGRLIPMRHDETITPRKFYCQLILGESGHLYIFRKIIVEGEEQ
jgi:tRNA A37 methylthiotransferase MiaB